MKRNRLIARDSETAGPPSVWTIARWLHPRSSLKDLGDQAVFLWRYALGWPHTAAWRAWLNEPRLGPIARLAPGLHKKITRPYVVNGWSNAQKLRALQAHYEFLFARLDAESIRKIFITPGLPLLSFTGAGECRYRVFLGYESKFNKEGELTLWLHSEQHCTSVSSLTVLIEPQPAGGHGLLIGALQGLPEGADKNIIKDVAKSLHGLRPKALLLFLAQELAAGWELNSIVGISNRRHISRHLVYFLNASRRPKLSYDEFWLECGGRPRADGLYVLPLRHTPRDLAELKPAKRPLYRRRYTLLEDLRHGFAAELALLNLFRPPSQGDRGAPKNPAASPSFPMKLSSTASPRHAFTLVEIMIVVVIIGLLAAMAIPAFQKVRQSSQDKAVLNNARQLAAASDQFFLENGVSSCQQSDLVGATNYVKALNLVANETYPGGFTQGITVTIAGVAGQRTITYAP